MADTFKFPGGYNVTVFKKQDILDCIDRNIIDKEIALAIVEQCEIDASRFISEGRWTSIPFIGSIRPSKLKQLESSPEQQAIIEAAKESLDEDKYVLFRKQLAIENSIQIKHERYYNYIVSLASSRNKSLYKKLCAKYGEKYTRIYMYASYNITALDNEYVIIDDNE
jgi:hypothetical protein